MLAEVWDKEEEEEEEEKEKAQLLPLPLPRGPGSRAGPAGTQWLRRSATAPYRTHSQQLKLTFQLENSQRFSGKGTRQDLLIRSFFIDMFEWCLGFS